MGVVSMDETEKPRHIAAPVEMAGEQALVAALRAELREKAAAEGLLARGAVKGAPLDRHIALQAEIKSVRDELEGEFGALRDTIER